MKHSETTAFERLHLDPAEPLDYLEVERQAQRMRAEVLAAGISALSRAVSRLFGYGRSDGAREASL